MRCDNPRLESAASKSCQHRIATAFEDVGAVALAMPRLPEHRIDMRGVCGVGVVHPGNNHRVSAKARLQVRQGGVGRALNLHIQPATKLGDRKCDRSRKQR